MLLREDLNHAVLAAYSAQAYYQKSLLASSNQEKNTLLRFAAQLLAFAHSFGVSDPTLTQQIKSAINQAT